MEFGLEEEEEESDKKTTAEVCDLKMNASSPSCLMYCAHILLEE